MVEQMFYPSNHRAARTVNIPRGGNRAGHSSHGAAHPSSPTLEPMVDAHAQRNTWAARARRWGLPSGASDRWTRIPASVILVAFGVTAIVVILQLPLRDRHLTDVVTAAITVAVGAGAFASRRAAIPAAAWATGAAILGTLPMIPPYESRVGDVTFYLGQQLTGVAWDASAGYLFAALAFAVCALMLGWSVGSSAPSPPPRPRSVLSLTVSVGLWLAAVGHLLGGLVLASIALSPYMGSSAIAAALVTVGGVGTFVVAWLAHQGRHQGLVARWSITMFVASSLAIVYPSAIWEWMRTGIALVSLLPIGVIYPIEVISRGEEGLVPQWFVAGAWLTVCLLVIADRIGQRRSENRTAGAAITGL